MKEWVKQVEKIDDRTVKFTLNKPNPRFKMDYFAVKSGAASPFFPSTSGKGRTRSLSRTMILQKGDRIYRTIQTGHANQNEVSYKRDDNWWGAKAGQAAAEAGEVDLDVGGPGRGRVALMADGKLDSLMDITLGAFQALQKRNPKIIAWTKQLPYAHIEPTCSERSSSIPP